MYLLPPQGRHICWWTISPRIYHLQTSQYFGTRVDTSAGGLLVPEYIICKLVSTSAPIWNIRFCCAQ